MSRTVAHRDCGERLHAAEFVRAPAVPRRAALERLQRRDGRRAVLPLAGVRCTAGTHKHNADWPPATAAWLFKSFRCSEIMTHKCDMFCRGLSRSPPRTVRTLCAIRRRRGVVAVCVACRVLHILPGVRCALRAPHCGPLRADLGHTVNSSAQVLDFSHNPMLTSCGLVPLLAGAPRLERLFLAHSTKASELLYAETFACTLWESTAHRRHCHCARSASMQCSAVQCSAAPWSSQ